MNEETLNAIGSLTKEQLLAMWESQQNEINTVDRWLKYLDNLPDETGFNRLVASNLLRVVEKWVNKLGTFDTVNQHFDEIRKETKDLCMWLPEFKEYFPVKNKKQMLEYDLSLYKFEEVENNEEDTEH